MSNYKHHRNNKKGKSEVLIDAEFRIKIEKDIEKFYNSNEMVYEFSAALTNVERAFVHNLAPKFNLQTKSNGLGANRKLSLYKLVEQEDFSCQNASIEISLQSKRLLNEYVKDHPVIEGQSDKQKAPITLTQMNCPTVLKNPPSIPTQCRQRDVNIQRIRQNLPIYPFKEKILDIIDRKRVILIHGSTGSGKTTQLPQYLMDLAAQRNQPCRILCTQPRRISAISSAERVCYERGVDLGSAIGYQIRLDSKIQSNTNCVFLTPGVFLRYLMAMKPQKVFSNITHCIIDEAHEHAKENDFLLTSIREHMDVNPNLKLIIMSATMDTAVFANYFGGLCEEISIFSKQFEVEELYLDDVLKTVNFTNKKIEELKRQYHNGELIKASKSAYVNEDEEEDDRMTVDELDSETILYLDEILEHMSTADNAENHFNQFFYLVQNENIPVNYRHSQTQMIPLMIAVGRGWKSMIENLLSLKADPNIKVNFGGLEMSSIDMAVQMFGDNSEIKETLMKFGTSKVPQTNEDSFNKALINIYQDSVLKSKTNNFIIEESVDLELILQLVEKIHFGPEQNGAILIFLPGFDDIIQLSNLINDRIRHGYTIFMLHSSMKTDDQKNVFKPTFQGRRKIILSTNIAESSITIDDVIYVIDSGREKQKSFDAISHSSSLRVQWISKASSNQRRGRAGRLRNGIVYRIYSRDRYKSMLDVTIPELLRTSLSEVCLQTKLLISNSSCSSIEEFLLKCIAGPSVANIRQSIKYLQKLGALDENENLTLLGNHLAHMPIDSKYGKMLINSIIFKCFDSILSLVSILSVGEQIFLLPLSPADRFKCISWRKNVAGESHSDHFMMIKIFKIWLNLKNTQQNDRRFCEEHFISKNHIEHVRGIRKQILGYLEQSDLVGKNQNHLNQNSENWSVLKAVICSGLYPFIARIERQRGSMYTEIDTKLTFHMSSVLFVKKEGYKATLRKLPVEWTVFEEKNRVGRLSMLKCNTLVSSFTVSLTCGMSMVEDEWITPKNFKRNHEGTGWDEDEWEDFCDDQEEKVMMEKNYKDLKIDGLLKFSATNEDAKIVLDLKSRINALINRFLADRHFKFSNADNDLVNTFAKVLDYEDSRCRLKTMDLSDNSVPSYNNGDNYATSQRQGPQNNGFIRSENQNNRGQNRGPMRSQQGPSNSRHSNAQTSSQSQRQYSNDYQSNNAPSNRQYFNDHQSNGTNGYAKKPSYQNQPNRAPRPKLEMRQPTTHTTNQKFFVLKVNSKKFIETLSSKVVVPLEELNFKIWQYQKIKSLVDRGTQVHIVFYSTHRSEFQGYGQVITINENQPLQFHYRDRGTWKLADFNATNFADEITQVLTDQKFFFHELDHLTGNSLILYFQQ